MVYFPGRPWLILSSEQQSSPDMLSLAADPKVIRSEADRDAIWARLSGGESMSDLRTEYTQAAKVAQANKKSKTAVNCKLWNGWV